MLTKPHLIPALNALSKYSKVIRKGDIAIDSIDSSRQFNLVTEFGPNIQLLFGGPGGFSVVTLDESEGKQGPQISQDDMSQPTDRCVSISPEYQTDFLWLHDEVSGRNTRKKMTYVSLDDLASNPAWPAALKTSYQSWVDDYNRRFYERLDKTRGSKATLWDTTAEEMAWQLDGFFLAWSISKVQGLRTVQYCPEAGSAGNEYGFGDGMKNPGRLLARALTDATTRINSLREE
ncbi:MAG: hypothetical protein M1820_004822 [Bogoriella megaspora]|nr:MAG: hypothetical protein M1820_004822 [Bogoriella megaspora]